MSCTCPFGEGSAVAHCTACHRTFTGPSAFDAHQTLTAAGTVCHDPATLTREDGTPRYTTTRHTPDGNPVWGRALRPGETPWKPRADENAAPGPQTRYGGTPQPSQAI